MNNIFRKIATRVSNVAGSAHTFVIALLLVILWASTGPRFEYSDTWQLVINTGTTIVTFLMVFLIQNTQNRDGRAVQLKLDELIRTSAKARDAFVDLEELTDEELAGLEQEFRDVRDKQVASTTMKRLHAKLEAERAKRLAFRDPKFVLKSINENLNRDITSINPLNRPKNEK